MKRPDLTGPLQKFCKHCWQWVIEWEWHECWVKVKFKIYKPIPPENLFTIVKYYKDSLQHSMVNCFWTVTLANLHDQIEFSDWNSLIGKQVVRKVKKAND